MAMSKKAAELLSNMIHSGSSEQLGVADILDTISQNGGEMETNAHLIGCAEEIRDTAAYFLREMGGQEKHPVKILRVYLYDDDNVHLLIPVEDEPEEQKVRAALEEYKRLDDIYANGDDAHPDYEKAQLVGDNGASAYLRDQGITIFDDVEDVQI